MQKLLNTHWIPSVWQNAERTLMMASPIILLVGGVATIIQVPMLPDIALMVTYLNFEVLIGRSFYNLFKDPRSLYSLMMAPAFGWIITCIVLTANGIKLPVDELWFRLFLVGIAFLFTTGFFQEYRSRRIFF